ncbi:MAG: radical SAM protein [Deltaproteobacteria bacterium]|nr:radical SAM protein [Deltaproteobacteria bacterium]
MLVSEIFLSIQGESTYAGLPCIFIRLAVCNLSCTWCDTPYAQTIEGSSELEINDIVNEVKRYNCGLVEITGGEPLVQAETIALVKRLLDDGFKVLIETNGSVSLAPLDKRAVKIVDVKCPSSGHWGTFLLKNLDFITAEDEVKFVIGDRNDYDCAKQFLSENVKDRTTKVLFAPVRPALEPRILADWILKDSLKVRLQLQLHTYIWDNERGR